MTTDHGLFDDCFMGGLMTFDDYDFCFELFYKVSLMGV